MKRRFTKCGRLFILPLLVVMRTVIMIYFFYFILYLQVLPICKSLYHLNDTNWWKSSTEPFFTNSSILCAAACWWLWIIFWCYIFALAFFFPLAIIISFVGLIFKKREGLVYSFKYIYKYIICTSMDKLGISFTSLKFYINGYFQYSENDLPKKFTNYNCLGSIGSGEGFTSLSKSGYTTSHCLLCVDRFTGSDEVVRMNCNKS